jgi:hypothetical protein
MASLPPPGWYADPDGSAGQQRYWDGQQWTDQRSDGPAHAAYPSAGYPVASGAASQSSAVKVLLWVLVGFFVLCGGGCFAFAAVVAGTDSEPDTASESQVSTDAPAPVGTDSAVDLSQQVRGDEDHPVVVHPGKAFNIRGFEYQPEWTLKNGYIGLEIENLRVKNMRDDKDSAMVDFKMWRGQEVVGAISCFSDPIAPGTTVTLLCSSTDDFTGHYDRLTISDTF